MDLHLDTSWCPVCDCAVDPARYTVLVGADGEQPQPASGAPRQNGSHGLVHGTGRVKPGGGLRPLDAAKRQPPSATPPAPPSSPASRTRPKLRSVVSQDQTPLYCSEKCQQEDARRALSPSLKPDAPPPPPPAYPFFHRSAPASSSSAQSQARSTHSEPAVSQKRPPLTIAGFTPLRRSDDGRKSKLDDYQYGGIMIGRKIEETLLSNRRQPQPPTSPVAVDENPFDSRVPAGWRHTDSEWRKICYGDIAGVPGPRIQLPERHRSMPSPGDQSHALPSQSVPEAPLGPFDRALPAANSVPSLNGFDELYHKYNMAFLRHRGQSSENLSPVSRRFSTSTVSSATTRSSSGSDDPVQASSPRRSTFSTVDSDPESEELEGDATLGFGFSGRRREYPSLKRMSLPGSSTSLAGDQPRNDTLARMLDAKAKEARMQEREARRVAQMEQEAHARRSGATLHEDNVDDWQRAVRKHGPIMGRRTMSTDDATKRAQHSWSYETLPPHIPLYPMPGYGQTRRTVNKQVVNEQTGEVEDRVEEAPAPERKRLFLFGSGR